MEDNSNNSGSPSNNNQPPSNPNTTFANINQSQPSSNPAVNQQIPVQQQPSTEVITTNNQNNDPKVSKNKKAAYFFVGLLFHFFAIIPILLWVSIKHKENRKPRLLSFLAGILTSVFLLIIFNVFISPMFQKQLVNKYPELAYIPNELVKEYPYYTFGVGFNKVKSLSGDNSGTTTSTLTVSVQTEQKISAEERKNMGMKVCNLLDERNENYSFVEISQVKVKKILVVIPFTESMSENRTCQEWEDDPPFDFSSVPF